MLRTKCLSFVFHLSGTGVCALIPRKATSARGVRSLCIDRTRAGHGRLFDYFGTRLDLESDTGPVRFVVDTLDRVGGTTSLGGASYTLYVGHWDGTRSLLSLLSLCPSGPVRAEAHPCDGPSSSCPLKSTCPRVLRPARHWRSSPESVDPEPKE